MFSVVGGCPPSAVPFEEGPDDEPLDDLPDALGGDSGEPGAEAVFGCDTSRTNATSIALPKMSRFAMMPGTVRRIQSSR